MNITVIGTGYVGLVTAVCFAQSGHSVVCLDRDSSKISTLEKGEPTHFEPGLKELLQAALAKGAIRFTIDWSQALKHSDCVFLCVGTATKNGHSLTTQHIDQASQEIAKHIKTDLLIGIKSTVPVGTTQKLQKLFQTQCPNHQVTVFANPEFLREGHAIQDFLYPARIIIGTDSEATKSTLTELYRPFAHKRPKLIFMDIPSAELCKSVANTMLATRISFMNEMAKLCEATGADIHNIRQGIGSDPRIGPDYLYAGLGFGGSCLPKDVQGLIETATQHGLDMPLTKSVMELNQEQIPWICQKIQTTLKELKNTKIAVWGLAYKANTDDVRNSPALKIINWLLEKGADIHAYDPQATKNVQQMYETHLTYHDHATSCLKEANALLVATDWREFKSLEFSKIHGLMARPLLFDVRNLYDPEQVKAAGFEYVGVGM